MVPIPEGSETASEASQSSEYGSLQEVLDQPAYGSGLDFSELRGSGGSPYSEEDNSEAGQASGRLDSGPRKPMFVDHNIL